MFRKSASRVRNRPETSRTTPDRRVRVGVIARGHILAEQVLERRTDVSVGRRTDATVQLPASDGAALPQHLEVLRVHNGGYFLVVPDDPSARVQLRGTDGGSPVVEVRGKRCVPVEHTAGGSVCYGDLTVMFQFVRADVRPTTTLDRTVLRIGLVHGDRLISDRIFRDQRRIRVGRDKRCDIVLDADYAGPMLAFHSGGDGSFEFDADAGIDTRLAVADAAPRHTDQLVESGQARRKGERIHCHLPLGSRGRARLGPYTVLYQVLRQRIVVPVSERQSIVRRLGGWVVQDVAWSASLAIATLLVTGVVGQALAYQATTGVYEKAARPAESAERGPIEVDIFERDEVEPPKPEEAEVLAPPEAAAPVKPVKAPERTPRSQAKAEAERPQSVGKTSDPTERKRDARAGAITKTIAGGLTGASARSRLWADSDGSDAEVASARFGTTGTESGAPTDGALAIPHGSQGQTAERVHVAAPTGLVRAPVAGTRAVKGPTDMVKIALPPLDGDDRVEGGTKIGGIVHRKASAIQRCYESALRANPGLGGKVSVRFTVGTAGTITAVHILGAAGGFAECIESKFRAIRGLPILRTPAVFTQSYVFTRQGG